MPEETKASAAATQEPADAVHGRDSLRTRIALWSGGVSLALLLLATLVAALVARSLILQEARRDIRTRAQETAQRLDATLRLAEIACAGVADAIAETDMDPDELSAVLRSLVAATPGASGAMLAVEPRRPGEAPFARYVAANGRNSDFVAIGYRYKSKGWYKRTLAAPNGWWSDPYFNETAGGTWIVTYNQPVRRTGLGDRARGMVSIDVPVGDLGAQVEDLAARPGWRVMLVAPQGLVAVDQEAGVALRMQLDDYIARLRRTDLAPLRRASLSRRPAEWLHADPRNGVAYFTAAEPVGDSGWTLAVSETYSRVLGRLHYALALVIAFGALTALASMLVVRHLANRISRPVEDLVASARHLARGQFYWAVPHTGRPDEVGLLARAMATARSSIQRQIVEIREMGAAQQKLESELAIARDIQLAMLSPPKTVAAGAARLEAHALLEPAKAVGGDFYVFIDRGGGEFWFAIGDVSDKGVPAALFMARTATELEVAVRTSTAPDRALAEASKRLVEGNDTCMFATVLCGRIDVRGGDCVLASAGHDPPLLLRAGGGVERLGFDGGPPLGVDACDAFPLWRGRLGDGDGLVAWTDGVSEAFDAANEAFGEDRLLAAVRPGYSAQDNCTRLLAEVHAFAAGAPQSDDITVLAIRRRESADAAAARG